MRSFILTALMSTIVPLTAAAEEITVTVKGMVCSFCAQGLKKAFGAEPNVEKVEPNMDEKTVVIVTRGGTELDDEKIKSIVDYAGYEVLKIDRK